MRHLQQANRYYKPANQKDPSNLLIYHDSIASAGKRAMPRRGCLVLIQGRVRSFSADKQLTRHI